MFIFSTGLSEVLQNEVILDGVSIMKQGWGDSCCGHVATLWTSELVGLGTCGHGCDSIR